MSLHSRRGEEFIGSHVQVFAAPSATFAKTTAHHYALPFLDSCLRRPVEKTSYLHTSKTHVAWLTFDLRFFLSQDTMAAILRVMEAPVCRCMQAFINSLNCRAT